MVKIKDTEAFVKILRLFNNKKKPGVIAAINIMISDRMSSFSGSETSLNYKLTHSTSRPVARGCNEAIAPQSIKKSTIAHQTKGRGATGTLVIMSLKNH